MTEEEAIEQLQTVMAHAWMVRAFLKHSEDVEDDVEMLGVHRAIFDYIRATEPSKQRGDNKEFLRRIRSKLPKLRKAAEYFAAEYRNVSDHTNFEMAAISLSGCVKEIDQILEQLEQSD